MLKLRRKTIVLVDKFHIVTIFIIYEVLGTHHNHELGSLGYDKEEETRVNIYIYIGTSIIYLEVHSTNSRFLKRKQKERHENC